MDRPSHTGSQNSQPEPSRASFDLLTKVRLPPPASSSSYGWTSGDSRQPLGDSTNMLRTPESIMRMHDTSIPLKRAAANSSSSSKRSRLASELMPNPYSEPHGQAHQRIQGRNHETGGTSRGSSGTTSAGLPRADANNMYRKSTNSSDGYALIYPNHSQQQQQQQQQQCSPPMDSMLSPSTTPFDRKSHYSNEKTPTRAERPMSVPSVPLDIAYERGLEIERRPTSMMMMPPLPNNSLAIAAAAAAAAAPSGQGFSSRHSMMYTDTSAPPVPSTQPGMFAARQASYQLQPHQLHQPHHLHLQHQHQHQQHQHHQHHQHLQNQQHQHLRIEIPAPSEMPKVEDDGKKPTYSYAMLIGMAILRAPERKLTLSQIYAWIMDTFEYYRHSKPTWHNSIRHNLSLNKAFEKKVRPKGDPGKGNYWTIVEGSEYQFIHPRPAKRSSEQQAQDDVPAYTAYQSPTLPTQPIVHTTSTTVAPSAVAPSAVSPASPVDPSHEPLESSILYDSAAVRGPEAMHSDGTEPDEYMLEEENDRKLMGRHSYTDSFDDTQQQPAAEHSRSFSVASAPLPQMHTMTSSSSSPRTDSAPKPAAKSPSDVASEWRGQGQFAFRCSTPSVPSSSSSSSSSFMPSSTSSSLITAGAAAAKPQVGQRHLHQILPRIELDPPHLSPPHIGFHRIARKESPMKQERVKSTTTTSATTASATAAAAAAAAAAAPSSQQQHQHEHRPEDQNDTTVDATEEQSEEAVEEGEEADQIIPKTPEKLSKTPQLMSASSSALHSSVFSGVTPNLAPPRSFESHYAGTLDLSPGLSFSTEKHSQPVSASRASYQRHRKNKSSSSNLLEFLEFDFRKPEPAGGHKRATSGSSDENSTQEPSQSSQTVHSSTHTASFLTFDTEMSPNLVMTPIRIPFDTPIRDQAHAYSPYGRSASSSFGSPMRRA